MFYYGVEVYETTTFSEFVYLVKSKIGIPDESKVSLSYKHLEELYYCVIVDGRGIKKLINVINAVRCKYVFVYVYVVVKESDGANEFVDSGKAYAEKISSGKWNNNPIGTFITPSIPHYHSVAKNVNIVQQPVMYVDP